jgi:hypothetical protein
MSEANSDPGGEMAEATDQLSAALAEWLDALKVTPTHLTTGEIMHLTTLTATWWRHVQHAAEAAGCEFDPRPTVGSHE